MAQTHDEATVREAAERLYAKGDDVQIRAHAPVRRIKGGYEVTAVVFVSDEDLKEIE